MNCHSQIWLQSPYLEPVRESFRTDRSIEWTRVHDLPDFVYFNHSIHVNKGVGCETCHGRVDRMPLVFQAARLQMGWCLECHRHPENFLRPEDQITNLDWKPSDVNPAEFVGKYGQPKDVHEDWSKKKKLSQSEIGQTLKERWKISPPTNCQGCHR